MAWKSAPVGEKPTRPSHSGSAKSRMLVGRSASVTLSVLYMTTVERARKPVQLPELGTYSAGMLSRAACGTGAKRPSLSTMLIAGRVLGEEDVGGGVAALLDDLVGHLEVLAAAQLDVEPGLLLEERDDLVEQLLVLGVVDDQVGRVEDAARAQGSDEQRGEGGAGPSTSGAAQGGGRHGSVVLGARIRVG